MYTYYEQCAMLMTSACVFSVGFFVASQRPLQVVAFATAAAAAGTRAWPSALGRKFHRLLSVVM